MRQKLMDWLTLVGIGMGVGLAVLLILMGVSWFRHGTVTGTLIELPTYGAIMLLLLLGLASKIGGRYRPNPAHPDDPGAMVTAQQRKDLRAMGAAVYLAAFWLFVFFLVFDAFRHK